MNLTRIDTPHAPAAIGPYSQAIAVANMLYCSGQIPIDPLTGHLILGDITEQTDQVLSNLDAILRAANTDRQHVVRCTIYLASMQDFAQVNQSYAAYFGTHRPARATVEVASLPMGARVEIDAIAWLAPPKATV